jgi:predicted metal-dependent hydrolase
MGTTVQLGETRIEVVRKDIKNVHLSVHPPAGRVRIAAPRHLSDDAIRAFAIAKLAWIGKQKNKLKEQERETPREYLDRETHYVWGHRCLLRLVEREASPSVEWRPKRLTLTARPGTPTARRAEILEAWYRTQLRAQAAPLAVRWQKLLGVRVDSLFVRRMKTRWGSCNPLARTIRLNTDLAKKPRECLEYILVHELVHLLEPTHNARFVALMDRVLPGWVHRRELLNRLPVRHEDWNSRDETLGVIRATPRITRIPVACG